MRARTTTAIVVLERPSPARRAGGHDVAGPAARPEERAVADESREVEHKLAVEDGFALPDLVGADAVVTVDEPQRHRLVAVYLDTPDLRLAREGVTLRRREGGDDAGWHLKLPARGKSARTEVALPLRAGAVDDVPAELADLVTAHTRRRPLEPVAVLRTDRCTQVLRGADGTALAEVALDDVAVLDVSGGVPTAGALDDARVLSGFRELEVEERRAEEDAPPVLVEVLACLQAAGAQPGQLVPKAVRALGPLATAPPDVPRPGDVDEAAPAAELVRAHVAQQVRALQAADVGVRRDVEDAVHQMRVAARRLRSGLKTFRPLLEREWADDLREELKWLAGELGGARDSEVLAQRLAADLDRLPESAGASEAGTLLERRAARDEQAGRRAALEALGSERYGVLLDRLVAAAALPPTTAQAGRPCAEVLPPLVRAAWKKLAKRARALGEDAPDEDWHEVRKRAKQVRYAAEAVRPALGRPAKRFARQVERVTEVLGDHQDAAVAAGALEDLLDGRPSARAAFALGALWEEQRREARDRRDDFLAVWPQVSAGGHRRWLRTGG